VKRSAQPLLDFQGIRVARGGHLALTIDRLQVQVGESLAILGPNGSGKSTLIKLINRECYPLQKADRVFKIMGHSTWNVFEMRRWLGIVSNDLQATFARDFTGETMLLSGYFSSVGLWPDHRITQAMRRRTRHLLRWLEIPHLAQRPVNQMSSGEARRLLIGRALVHAPKALLLDEPTTSLDLRAAKSIRELLRKVARAGTAILLVTHHVDDLIPEIQRVVCLRKGRLWKDGPTQKVLTSATLTNLFKTPVRLERRAGYFRAW
jgi:iron complex transport system ATP-binding protein